MARYVTSAFVVILVLASTYSLPQTDTKTVNSTNAEPRIAGGTNATTNEFPYQVAIFAKGSATLRCGGALITDNFVLTSAYCAKLGSASDIEVMVGNTELSRGYPSVLAGVKMIYIHNNYDTDGRKSDVALLKLNQNLNIRQASVGAIDVREQPYFIGDRCTFTGWGSEAWNGLVSKVLKKVNLTIVDNTECSKRLGQSLQSLQFCAANEERRNACFLDEGSPLACGNKLTGILSYSVNCGTQNRPSVYTDVVQHSAWIKQIISTSSNYAARNSMSYVTIAAMIAVLSYHWSCRA
jgi:secreted trypsin-like serine protease